jgi:hypothetical protein
VNTGCLSRTTSRGLANLHILVSLTSKNLNNRMDLMRTICPISDKYNHNVSRCRFNVGGRTFLVFRALGIRTFHESEYANEAARR